MPRLSRPPEHEEAMKKEIERNHYIASDALGLFGLFFFEYVIGTSHDTYWSCVSVKRVGFSEDPIIILSMSFMFTTSFIAFSLQ